MAFYTKQNFDPYHSSSLNNTSRCLKSGLPHTRDTAGCKQCPFQHRSACSTHPSWLEEAALASHTVLNVYQLLQVFLGGEKECLENGMVATLPSPLLTTLFPWKWYYRIQFQGELRPGILCPESLLPAFYETSLPAFTSAVVFDSPVTSDTSVHLQNSLPAPYCIYTLVSLLTLLLWELISWKQGLSTVSTPKTYALTAWHG